MQSYENDYSVVAEALWAQAIGQEVLKVVKSRGEDIDQKVKSEALELLEEIKAVLDDDTLDDPTCFYRIDAIVDIFGDAGISTTRHDW